MIEDLAPRLVPPELERFFIPVPQISREIPPCAAIQYFFDRGVERIILEPVFVLSGKLHKSAVAGQMGLGVLERTVEERGLEAGNEPVIDPFRLRRCLYILIGF